MNNLEFRALYKLTNKYANIDSIDFTNQIVVLTSYPLVRSFGLDKVAFDEVIIEQYTGLKDKNGKKIYEGDILDFTYQLLKYPPEKYRGVVEFGNPNGLYDWGWAIRFIGKEKPSNTYILLWVENEEAECLVVGNIHENPELLGKK